MDRTLTIIIPAYNEELSIGNVVKTVLEQCSDIISELLVVDDGSKDNTGSIAREAGARVIQHKKNLNLFQR